MASVFIYLFSTCSCLILEYKKPAIVGASTLHILCVVFGMYLNWLHL